MRAIAQANSLQTDCQVDSCSRLSAVNDESDDPVVLKHVLMEIGDYCHHSERILLHAEKTGCGCCRILTPMVFSGDTQCLFQQSARSTVLGLSADLCGSDVPELPGLLQAGMHLIHRLLSDEWNKCREQLSLQSNLRNRE